MFFAPSKSRERAKIQIVRLSKTTDDIQIKTKMPNFSQEPAASSKAPNEDLKAMDVLCTFKIKIESQNLDHGYIKDKRPYPNQDQDKEWQNIKKSMRVGLELKLKQQVISVFKH